MKPYAAAIRADIEAAVEQAASMLDQARQVPEGWVTPDGGSVVRSLESLRSVRGPVAVGDVAGR